ncbi:hypothetical protein BG006_007774 [Podila minutissima]|uniref:DNA ligase n=1 Tax=Podila minutissima TaxID=64525 RepID=A0A9P5VK32_9FUNG|nr:hypothetical protein BG006_007774 [Podila minutissima]
MAQDAQQVMLAHSWGEDTDPSGYWMSEKLDGVRAYFDGQNFYSRAGNRFHAPPFFSKHLPKDQPLDGELWLGRGRFQQCISVVKNQKVDRADEWTGMTYLVFDAPKLNMVYEKRLEYLKSIMPIYGNDKMPASPSSPSFSPTSTVKIPPYARLVPAQKCKSKAHLLQELKHVQDHGGEGIMLRAPRSRYEFRRSKTLLKVKTFFDEEAIVLARVKGSGKNSHRMGHLEVKTPDGRTFSVGSGFTDAQRDKPPKVGAIITYKFQELSNKLTPRFPIFLGERIDIKWEDYCKTYTAPTLKAATSANVVSLLKQKSLIFQDGDDKDVNGKDTKAKGFLDGDDEDPSDEDSTGDSDLDTPKSVSSPSTSTSSSSKTDTTSSAVSTPSRKRAATGASSRVVMSDSDDDDDSSATKSRQPACKYGASCYRRNPDHLKQFSHPNKRAKS